MANEASLRTEGEEILFGLDMSSLKEESVDFGGKEALPSDVDADASAAHHQHVIQRLLASPDFSLEHPATDEDFSILFEWATERGARFPAIQWGRDAHGGRGLFCTHSVTKGGILAVLPRSLRIGQKLACQRIPSLSSNTPNLTALSLLLLEFGNNDDSEYQIFVKTLPRRDEFTNAIFMSDDEIEKWNSYGSEYRQAIETVRQKCNACVSYIHDFAGKSDDDDEVKSTAIQWVIAMVLSRSHAFGSQTGRWLTPVLDLANHAAAENATARLEVDAQGGLLLNATRDLVEGQQVTLDYQERKDEHLVATYGFSLLHS